MDVTSLLTEWNGSVNPDTLMVAGWSTWRDIIVGILTCGLLARLFQAILVAVKMRKF